MTLLPKALITTKRSPPNVPSQVFRSRFRVCDLAGLNRPLLQPMRGISRWKKTRQNEVLKSTPLQRHCWYCSLLMLFFWVFYMIHTLSIFACSTHGFTMFHICVFHKWMISDTGEMWCNMSKRVSHTVPLKRGSTWLNNFWYSRPGLLSYTSTLSAQGAFVDNVALWCLESW